MATITYNGVTHRPDNAASPDGDLALCLNLVNDNGTLTPLEEPTLVGSLPSWCQPLFIHSAATFKHVIAYETQDNSVIWIDFDSISDLDWGEYEHWGYIVKNLDEAPSIAALGNTLILSFKNHPLQYAIWKNDSYTALGSHPPFIPIQFCLNSAGQNSTLIPNNFDCFSFDDIEYPDYTAINPNGSTQSLVDGTLEPFDKFKNESYQQYLTEPVFALLNKSISFNCYEGDQAKFIFPFFVRYAIRFYDGSLTQHSFPILLTPNSKILAQLTNLVVETRNQIATVEGNGIFRYNLATLIYRILDVPDELSNWMDLIQGIDIFISAPIYTHNQSGYIKGWTTPESSYIPDNITDIHYDYQLLLPFKESETINTEIEDTSLFYKIFTIPLKDIVKTGTDLNGNQLFNSIKLDANKFSSITSQEVMQDDLNSHRNKIAHSLIYYNSRLNLGGVSEQITNQVPVNSQTGDFCYINPITGEYISSPSYPIEITTQIAENSQTLYLLQGSGDFPEFPRYLFFNTPNAKRLYIKFNDNNYVINLKEHSGLNGAVYFRGFGDNMPDTTDTIPDGTDLITVKHPNKIYTSDVDNPFTFRSQNINTIGSGEIRALCAATQAISQGQFGAFPLYAFTDEGIWALSVSSTGGWSSIQPVTHDVIIAGSQPLNIDKAVVFFSAQGLMLLQGGDVSCLSALLDSDNGINLPADYATTEHFSTDCLNAVKLFPKIAELAYDYAHSRIYVLSNNIYWVYSLKSRIWSHATGAVGGAYALNGYTNTILAESDDNNIHLSTLDANCDKYDYASLITRPLKFESSSLRTIRSVVTRGLLATDSFKSILYASINNRIFTPVAGCESPDIRRISGSAYHSHCLSIILTGLEPDFAINSTEFDILAKHTNKQR